MSDPRKDDLRERLAALRRTRPVARTSRGPRTRAKLDDLDGAVRTDGVFILERGLAKLAPEETGRLLSAMESARRSVLARDDIDEEVRTLLLHPHDALFIDTETTGLGGNMVFLLGAMRICRNDVVLTQVLARDYAEEPALLSAWAAMLSNVGALVSFNGKSFDLPILRERLGFHRLAAPPEPMHVDLLHHARRRWRDVLPDCRLQTLEWRVCGRRRAGDIPGAEIPEVYHRFVRTGDPADILSIIHHNALDLVTLADLAQALTAPEVGPA
jgi:uncharacterized protein YprB with RNaseH-like and TPR domain